MTKNSILIGGMKKLIFGENLPIESGTFVQIIFSVPKVSVANIEFQKFWNYAYTFAIYLWLKYVHLDPSCPAVSFACALGAFLITRVLVFGR